MGSYIKCICGMLINTDMFCVGTPVYMLIKDSDYDALNDGRENFEDWDKPVEQSRVEDLFLHKGTPVYRCTHCGRLVVDREQEPGRLFYLPEGKVREEKSEKEPSALSHLQKGMQWEPSTPVPLPADATDDERRLRELEIIADTAYKSMYDAANPAECYSNAKAALADAIGLAGRMSRQSDVERLGRKDAFVKAVFRSQVG